MHQRPLRGDEYESSAKTASAPKVSEIVEQGERLNRALNHLSALSEELSARLQPIVRPIPVGAGGSNKNAAEHPMSPLADHMRSSAVHAESIVDRLQGLLQSLAV